MTTLNKTARALNTEIFESSSCHGLKVTIDAWREKHLDVIVQSMEITTDCAGNKDRIWFVVIHWTK